MTNPIEFSEEGPEIERFPQMSEADMEEMRGQIPALREMLGERRAELARLKADPEGSLERIVVLEIEIKELLEEIEGRE